LQNAGSGQQVAAAYATWQAFKYLWAPGGPVDSGEIPALTSSNAAEVAAVRFAVNHIERDKSIIRIVYYPLPSYLPDKSVACISL